nr:hypothetical protein [Tanacetum cinerariifolium]
WDVHTITGRYVSMDFIVSDAKLAELGSIELTDNKYLIDVAGYVTNVGQITQQKSGSRTLDFSLASGSGQAIRVTLWEASEMPWLRGKQTTLWSSNAESRLMASGHERDETSNPVVVRNVRKELCRMREVSSVRRVKGLLSIQC